MEEVGLTVDSWLLTVEIDRSPELTSQVEELSVRQSTANRQLPTVL
jgi:hypothetical protein